MPDKDLNDKSAQNKSGGVKGLDDVSALEKQPGTDSEALDASVSVSEKSFGKRIAGAFKNINPYLIMFLLVVALTIVIAVVASKVNEQNNPSTLTFDSTELDQQALDQLKLSEQNVGDVDQTLTVAANAIFNGKILVKNDLDVAGTIRVGGPLKLPGITVSGASEFDDVNIINNLSILGSTAVQGSLTVQQGLNVTGDVSVAGTVSATKISADTIEFNGNLSLTKHIDTGGSTPTATRGTAVGSGGTVSISGNDISGTTTINTGGGPPSGILVKVTFSTSYNSTPNIQITPIGSGTASLSYYVTRDTDGFSIGTTNAPSASTTYVFDYFVTE